MKSRSDRRSSPRGGTPTGTYIAIAAVAVVVIVAIVIAVLIPRNSGDPDFDPSSYSVQVSGSPLLPLPSSPPDPSIGSQAPQVTGTDFDGNTVRTTPDGRPTVILFLAHWCPHCQNEVRWLTPWFADNGLPQDVRILSVATSIDATAPNYPPDRWLKDAGWPVPVIVDNQQEAIKTYFGLNAFPFWVVLNGDGTVLERFTGELEADQFEQLIEELS